MMATSIRLRLFARRAPRPDNRNPLKSESLHSTRIISGEKLTRLKGFERYLGVCEKNLP